MNITVDKAELLGILETNRLSHIEKFTEAHSKYNEKLLDGVRDLAQQDRVKKSELQKLTSMLVPESYEDDYNRAISMVKLHTGDKLTMSEHEYSNYVDDQWGWSRGVALTNSSYGVK